MSAYPYVLNRSPGPHGYIILFAGRQERQEITEEFTGMITRLCELREAYCLAD